MTYKYIKLGVNLVKSIRYHMKQATVASITYISHWACWGLQKCLVLSNRTFVWSKVLFDKNEVEWTTKILKIFLIHAAFSFSLWYGFDLSTATEHRWFNGCNAIYKIHNMILWLQTGIVNSTWWLQMARCLFGTHLCAYQVVNVRSVGNKTNYLALNLHHAACWNVWLKI